MTNELWQTLRAEAEEVIKQEPLLASYVYACVLNHDSLEGALSFILAYKLTDSVMPAVTVRELYEHAFSVSPELIEYAVYDLKAVYERDAATSSYLPVILYLKAWDGGRPAHCLFLPGLLPGELTHCHRSPLSLQ